MSDIPEDILAVAEDIASLIPSRVSSDNRAFAALVIGRAILAERERCYRIAVVRRSTPSRDLDIYGTTLAIDIASAIRHPLPAQPEGRAAP